MQINIQKVSSITNTLVNQYTGYVTAHDAINLARTAGLNPNPRRPKRKDIVREIIQTLTDHADVFPYLSGGITVACDSFDPLTNNITFSPTNRNHEGLLDGGHTALALISWAYGSRPNNWTDAEQLLQNPPQNTAIHTTLVPITIIYGDHATIAQISRTKNRSAQVSRGALLHNEGVFADLRKHLDPNIDKRIAWRDQDESARVNIGDLVNLLHLPLNAVKDLNPNNLNPALRSLVRPPCRVYKDRTNVLAQSVQILQIHPTDTYVISAVRALNEIAITYDLIQEDFKHTYNDLDSPFSGTGGKRRFGTLDTNGRRNALPTHFLGKTIRDGNTVPKSMVLPMLNTVISKCTNQVSGEVVDLQETWKTYKTNLVRVYADQLDQKRNKQGKITSEAWNTLAESSKSWVYTRLRQEIHSR